ncbi:hypothetical protein Phum_PHUM551850 [Pediculus humanus corporis]|uniref:Uncharacterized protein n=1 Tax=Pediculus humanus subsp. corporis TaxID=121224 RepID=E0W0F9_PEDHC|nr:uncharacterized protein Phum_PHUM551850 [Pediculus humanus corporis]EEB19115.1 hypothetical protein Phum_PHUM551850 [Pediculus humanus corporis]
MTGYSLERPPCVIKNKKKLDEVASFPSVLPFIPTRVSDEGEEGEEGRKSVTNCFASRGLTVLPCGNGVGLAEKLEEEAEENFSSSSDEDVFSLRVKEKNLNSILENQSTEENDPERLKKEEEIMITGSTN